MLLRCLNIIGCLLSTYTRTTSPIPANKNRKNTKTKGPKDVDVLKHPPPKKPPKYQQDWSTLASGFLSEPVRLKGTLIIINGDYQ